MYIQLPMHIYMYVQLPVHIDLCFAQTDTAPAPTSRVCMLSSHPVRSQPACLRCPLLQVHLFDVDVPNGPVLLESRTTAPGNEVGC
jgi:hypothetical protein